MTADAQDRLAAVIAPVLRDSIKIRMTGLGPNAESVIRNGGAVHLTPAETEEVAAHVAAALAPVVAEARAEERERIAQAIEAEADKYRWHGPGYRHAVRIARADREQQP